MLGFNTFNDYGHPDDTFDVDMAKKTDWNIGNTFGWSD